MIDVGAAELAGLLLLAMVLAVTVLLAGLARRSGSRQLVEVRAENARLAAQVAELDRRLNGSPVVPDPGARPIAPDPGSAGPRVTPGRDHAPHPDAGTAGQSDDPGYLITRVGERPPGTRDPAPAATGERIEGRLFADLVLRESVVKAASLAHGLRRALDPETRNRIRFRMRQQTRQARRDRKVEAREALREYRARRTGEATAGDGDAA